MYAMTDYASLPYIEFDVIETHLRYPERKADQLIGQQIGGNFTDLIFQEADEPDYINSGDMDFWFDEPKGGWRQGIARYYFLEELAVQKIIWPRLAKTYDGNVRKPMTHFKEGDIIDGTCTSIQLHHGIVIDCGAIFLGLLPMNEAMWEMIYTHVPYERYEEIRPDFDILRPGKGKTNFKCKIRRILDHKYFRWPLELDIIEPSWLSDFIIPVGNYEPRLLVIPESLSNFDEREYARMSGRPYRNPRRYAYRYTDYTENHFWLQTQLDYFPEDHGQHFMRYDASSLTHMIKWHQEDLIRKLEMSQLLPDDEDIVATINE
jgi:hypothetical protein